MRGHLAEGCRGFGYDISQTACAEARITFPELSFQPLDLTVLPEKPCGSPQLTGRRLFMLRGILWYVFPELAQVIRTIRSLMLIGDDVLVVQNFPPLRDAFIGKNVIPDHHSLIGHLAGSFIPVRYLWYVDTFRAANDNWFVGLFSPRDT